jgi:transposase InsO family protein
MPFKETCVADEKLGFVSEHLNGEFTMTELCERYGISRQWGYELVRRYRAEGIAGLEPRSCAPHRHGRAMPEAIAMRILEVRQARPSWGPKKLRAWLQRLEPQTAWPVPSTMGDLLRRAGVSERRRRRRTPLPLTQPFAPVRAPNDLWCIDFKGWFRTGDGQRCDPLTLTDADSRFLIACRIVEPTLAAVQPVVDAAFQEHGLPAAIRSDNGTPFASSGAGGLTRLAVHWLKLGIRLERTAPASPQQNGRHERMHATLKKETIKPPADSPAEQQARFDGFRADFNHNRPHEALDQATPASRFRPSPRAYPDRIPEPVYPADQLVRRVRSNGEIKWRGERIFLSEPLVGEPVGVAETETGDWLVRFLDLPLALIDRRTQKLRPIAPARPGRRDGSEKSTRKTVNNVSGL